MFNIEAFLNKLAGATVPLQFGEVVLAGATQTVEYIFEADGVLQGVFRIRFYQGTELDLWIYPVIRGTDGAETNIIQYRGTKKYVDGENEVLPWNIRKKVKRGDIMRITAVNNDPAHDYDYRVDASVNYIGRVA